MQYTFKNNKYPKTLQEAVYVMQKVKFKAENHNDKSITKQMKFLNKINRMRQVLHKLRTMGKKAFVMVQERIF